MPVEGLPATVERVINDLIVSNHLSSFKIAGNPHVTTIVLRFGVMADHGMAKPGADSCESKGSLRTPHTSPGTWHRKSPSEMRRDQHRSYNHFHQRPSSTVTQSSPSLAEVSMPPRSARGCPQGGFKIGDLYTTSSTLSDTVKISSLSYTQPGVTSDPVSSLNSKETTQYSLPKAHCLSSDLEKPPHVNNTGMQKTIEQVQHSKEQMFTNSAAQNMTNEGMLSLSECDNTSENDNILTTSQRDDKPEETMEQGHEQQQNTVSTHENDASGIKSGDGVSLEDTVLEKQMTHRDKYTDFETFIELHEKDNFPAYLQSLGDRIKEKLKDGNRNNSILKVILDSFEGKRSMILESDDLVIDCDLQNFQIHRWYAKEAASSHFETMRLKHLNTFPVADLKDLHEEKCLAELCLRYILRFIDKLFEED